MSIGIEQRAWYFITIPDTSAPNGCTVRIAWNHSFVFILLITYILVLESKWTDFEALRLSTNLIPNFEIVVLPCCCTAIISTFHRILSPPANPESRKPTFRHFSLKLSTYLVPSFKIKIPPHYHTPFISIFPVILPSPVDLAYSKTSISAFLSKMLVLYFNTR